MNRDYLSGEHRCLEYKATLSRTLLKSVSAFSNYHDGTIVIGIRDDNTIAGVPDVVATRLALEHMIQDSIVPRPFFRIETIEQDGKDLIVLHVLQGEKTPYTFDNKAYKRSDTSTLAVDRFGYNELVLRGKNQSYEEQLSDMTDLSFQRLEQMFRDHVGISAMDEDVFRSLELMRKDRFTNAAVLLSDSNPLPHANIALVRFEGIAVTQIGDVQRLSHRSVLQQFEDCLDFYRKHISQGEAIRGAYHDKVEEVPLVAYREAIANALVHRDYSRPAETRVEVFDDRIEIVSPGGLPAGLTLDEYRTGRVSMPRNRILADIFLRLGIIERLATGIRRIRQYYSGQDDQPQFDASEHSVRVILPRMKKPNDKNRSAPSIPPVQELTEQETSILHLIRQHGEITRREVQTATTLGKTQAYSILNRLVERRILVRTGNARSTTYRMPNQQ